MQLEQLGSYLASEQQQAHDMLQSVRCCRPTTALRGLRMEDRGFRVTPVILQGGGGGGGKCETTHEGVLLLLQVLRVGEALLATQQAQLLSELLRVAGESADTPGVQLLQVPGPSVSDMQSFMRQENIVRKSKFVPGAMGVARAASSGDELDI